MNWSNFGKILEAVINCFFNKKNISVTNFDNCDAIRRKVHKVRK